jgi:hypothetical protein
MSRVPTALVAALGLVVAFAVAQGTGNRALGGVVLLAVAVWCAVRAWRPAGAARVVGVLVAGLVCFAGAHPLGHVIGAWPAVAVAALLLGGVTYALVDRPAARTVTA